MKKSIYTLSLFTAVFLLTTCKKVQKDVMDYYPKVTTVSATVQPDGSVIMQGTIVSSGTSSIEYSGFCMGTMSTPKMTDNQALSTSTQGNNFYATYSGFNSGTKYYFRSWATNGDGWSYGNIISLDSIVTQPVVATCSPAMNSVNIGGGNPTETYISVGAPAQGPSSWDFQASSNSNTVNFSFGESPLTKIYTTTTSNTPGPTQVYIYFYSGFISGALNDGSPVYVNKSGASTWVITICNAPWVYNSSTFNFLTKFTCPL